MFNLHNKLIGNIPFVLNKGGGSGRDKELERAYANRRVNDKTIFDAKTDYDREQVYYDTDYDKYLSQRDASNELRSRGGMSDLIKTDNTGGNQFEKQALDKDYSVDKLDSWNDDDFDYNYNSGKGSLSDKDIASQKAHDDWVTADTKAREDYNTNSGKSSYISYDDNQDRLASQWGKDNYFPTDHQMGKNPYRQEAPVVTDSYGQNPTAAGKSMGTLSEVGTKNYKEANNQKYLKAKAGEEAGYYTKATEDMIDKRAQWENEKFITERDPSIQNIKSFEKSGGPKTSDESTGMLSKEDEDLLSQLGL